MIYIYIYICVSYKIYPTRTTITNSSAYYGNEPKSHEQMFWGAKIIRGNSFTGKKHLFLFRGWQLNVLNGSHQFNSFLFPKLPAAEFIVGPFVWNQIQQSFTWKLGIGYIMYILK